MKFWIGTASIVIAAVLLTLGVTLTVGQEGGPGSGPDSTPPFSPAPADIQWEAPLDTPQSFAPAVQPPINVNGVSVVLPEGGSLCAWMSEPGPLTSPDTPLRGSCVQLGNSYVNWTNETTCQEPPCRAILVNKFIEPGDEAALGPLLEALK